jgi:phosphate-selective porin OprO/OprP
MPAGRFNWRRLLVLSVIGLAVTLRSSRAEDAAPFPIAPVAAPLSAEPVRLALDDSLPADAPPSEFLPDDEEPELDDIDALLKRIEELEAAEARRKAAEQKQADDEKKKKEDEAQKALDWADVSSEKWTVKLGGHVQLDYINWADSSPSIPNTQDYFEFRRLRLTADGTGYGVYDFRFQLTIEPESVGENPPGVATSPDVKDAYFSINEVPWLGRVRIGNFFVPFGLEQVTNDTNNIFMERSIPTQGVFTANREVGLAIYNCTDDQRITWASGVFFDSISETLKERIDNNQGYRASGRLTWVPYYDEPSNGRYLVHTGIGILHTEDQNERVQFSARPQIHEGPEIIDSGVLAADNYTTGNLELAINMGRVTLQSEAFASSVDMLAGGRETVQQLRPPELVPHR